MTGDTVEECLNNEKSEKIDDNIDTMLLSNLTENYMEPVEDVPCPEFQFSVSNSKIQIMIDLKF